MQTPNGTVTSNNVPSTEGSGTAQTPPATPTTTPATGRPNTNASWWSKWRPKIVGFGLVLGGLWLATGIYQNLSSSKSFSKEKISDKTTLLGVVDVPTDKWSEEIKNPEQVKISWGRIDWTKGDICEVMLDKDPKKIFPIKTETHIGPEIIQFKCSSPGARIEVKTKK